MCVCGCRDNGAKDWQQCCNVKGERSGVEVRGKGEGLKKQQKEHCEVSKRAFWNEGDLR